VAGEPAGDCIDCNQCVAVCPTGIDIREGSQLGCIQCGLCIDACDGVMTKVGLPTGLIDYDSEFNLEQRLAGKPERSKVLRPRIILYVVLIAAVAAFMGYTFIGRSSISVASMHDRNPLFVRLSDGSIRNAYTVRVINKALEDRSFELSVAGLPELRIEALGTAVMRDDAFTVGVGPATTREMRVLVTVPPGSKGAASQDITFTLFDPQSGETAVARDHFIRPTE